MFFPHKTLRHYIKTSLDVKGFSPITEFSISKAVEEK